MLASESVRCDSTGNTSKQPTEPEEEHLEDCGRIVLLRRALLHVTRLSMSVAVVDVAAYQKDSCRRLQPHGLCKPQIHTCPEREQSSK